MITKNLDLLIPKKAAPVSSFMWATVTQASPLRIRLDGELEPLGITPDTLINGLVVNDRVWVQVVNRRLVVMGRSELQGSDPGFAAAANWGISALVTVEHGPFRHIRFRATWNSATALGTGETNVATISNSHWKPNGSHVVGTSGNSAQAPRMFVDGQIRVGGAVMNQTQWVDLAFTYTAI